LPLLIRGQQVHVAFGDPLDYAARDAARVATTLEVVPFYVPEVELRPAIELAWSGIDFRLDEAPTATASVERMIAEAASLGASDVHVEPKLGRYRVRARVDGVLHEVDQVESQRGQELVARLKVMAGLDITEKRMPQDGRARFERGADRKSLRISTLPTLHGEKAVVRLLDQSNPLRIDELGLDEGSVAIIRRLMARKEGLFLVVGPTGCGKTTTLYASLCEVDSLERSITTVEDPVEYESAGFTQTQVGSGGSVLSFADALKAILRQDPDIVLLGEMRDLESASIATRLALTGCLVVSSLHAYDATSAVVRLVEMGVPSYVCAAVLRVVLAQRLVRRLCPYCKAPRAPDTAIIRSLDPHCDMGEVIGRGDFRGPVGCERCNGIGYRGRMPVFELLEMDSELRAMLDQRPTVEELRRVAVGRGLRTMQSSALRRAMAGETSLEEAVRVM
jgi:type II secretory ATPase GspE/PulE/Tfp pilus assembly ATPase PilB-like protein